MKIVVIDGRKMTDRETAHTYLKRKLDLPEYYGRNLDAGMTKHGFCMFVRSGNSSHRRIMERFPDAVVIYSMWKGYLEQPQMQAFLEGFSRIDLHTSGHADGSTIRTVIDTIDPGCIIPMHTERPDGFLALSDGRKILFAQDGVPVTL